MKLRFLDISAILLSLLVVVAFSLFAYSGRSEGRDVIIEASGKQWIYPIVENRIERVHGPLGETIVEIGDGRVRVQDSPCPDKVCVRSGAISRPGRWIACLPNRVLVRIGGKSGQSRKLAPDDESVDDTSY